MSEALIEKPIISADSHIVEPANVYQTIDKKFADEAPRMIREKATAEGGAAFYVKGYGNEVFPIVLAGAAGVPSKDLGKQQHKGFDGVQPGGWDPTQRLAAQDRDGVSAELLYPSLGMFLCNHPNGELKAACFRAYNDWLEEYCSFDPKRLIGLGQTAMLTPEEGIKDLHKMKAQGMKGVMMPGFPVLEDYHSKIYDPFWAAAVELDMPVSFHILTYKSSLGECRGPGINTFMGLVRGNQDIIGMLIFGGVFERFPKLKVVCVEADAGWAPHYMHRMDHAYKRSKPEWMEEAKLSKMPSEYFRENIYVTFQDDIVAFKMKSLFNIERMMWANDFPHLDSTWPGSQELLLEHTETLTQDEKTKVLHDNVANLYKLAV